MRAADVALMAEIALPEAGADGAAPQFIHLLPAGSIQTFDGRGPYTVTDAEKLIADSMARSDRLVIDENHATDLSAPNGGPAPARGWITALEAREDGIWGRVEWTPAGSELVKSRAYRGISPVMGLNVKSPKTVVTILRASLVNQPNLRGLATLHQESDVNATILKALGLSAEASEEDALAAIAALKEAKPDVAMQARIGEIGVALGVAADADQKVILEAARKAKDTPPAITALQSELASVTTELNTLKTDSSRTRATTFVDGAITKGTVGVKVLREHYIAMHMADAARVEKEIAALPVLGPSGALQVAPTSKDGTIELNSEQLAVATALGQDPVKFAAALKADRAAKEAHQ